jgi:hypothetical protein
LNVLIVSHIVQELSELLFPLCLLLTALLLLNIAYLTKVSVLFRVLLLWITDGFLFYILCGLEIAQSRLR